MDRIDGVFSGPRRKIRRDWSAIPICSMADVKLRSFLPAWSQIKEVAGEMMNPIPKVVPCNGDERIRVCNFHGTKEQGSF